MWYCAVLTSGYSCAIAAKRSSQYGMLWMMPFDLVADVTCRPAASGPARTRSASPGRMPLRVKTACWTASSSSVPS